MGILRLLGTVMAVAMLPLASVVAAAPIAAPPEVKLGLEVDTNNNGAFVDLQPENGPEIVLEVVNSHPSQTARLKQVQFLAFPSTGTDASNRGSEIAVAVADDAEVPPGGRRTYHLALSMDKLEKLCAERQFGIDLIDGVGRRSVGQKRATCPRPEVAIGQPQFKFRDNDLTKPMLVMKVENFGRLSLRLGEMAILAPDTDIPVMAPIANPPPIAPGPARVMEIELGMAGNVQMDALARYRHFDVVLRRFRNDDWRHLFRVALEPAPLSVTGLRVYLDHAELHFDVHNGGNWYNRLTGIDFYDDPAGKAIHRQEMTLLVRPGERLPIRLDGANGRAALMQQQTFYIAVTDLSGLAAPLKVSVPERDGFAIVADRLQKSASGKSFIVPLKVRTDQAVGGRLERIELALDPNGKGAKVFDLPAEVMAVIDPAKPNSVRVEVPIEGFEPFIEAPVIYVRDAQPVQHRRRSYIRMEGAPKSPLVTEASVRQDGSLWVQTRNSSPGPNLPLALLLFRDGQERSRLPLDGTPSFGVPAHQWQPFIQADTLELAVFDQFHQETGTHPVPIIVSAKQPWLAPQEWKRIFWVGVAAAALLILWLNRARRWITVGIVTVAAVGVALILPEFVDALRSLALLVGAVAALSETPRFGAWLGQTVPAGGPSRRSSQPLLIQAAGMLLMGLIIAMLLAAFAAPQLFILAGTFMR